MNGVELCFLLCRKMMFFERLASRSKPAIDGNAVGEDRAEHRIAAFP